MDARKRQEERPVLDAVKVEAMQPSCEAENG
jgi:hypothetical protein